MSLREAADALRAGRVDEARVLCRACLAQNPGDLAARHLLARVLETAGQPSAALAELEEVDVSLRPAALVDRVRLLARLDRRADALLLCGSAAAGAPPVATRELNILGELAGRLGAPEQAAACFAAALEQEPQHLPARFNLALARLVAGRTAEAAELLEQVTRAAPDFAQGWLHLGGVFNALGRYRDAVAALARHLELAPDSAPGWTWLGASHQYLGDFPVAEQHYRRAIELNPAEADALANLGRLLHASGRADEAETALREALKVQPDHVIARAGLAARREREGRFEEALGLLSGDAPETRLHRARLLRRQGRHDQALEELSRVRGDPGAPRDARRQAAFSTAQALDEAGRESEAAAELVTANAERFADWRAAGWDDADEVRRLRAAVADLRAAFGGGRDHLPRTVAEGEPAVFIVGMPRAGKSLLEQALAAHPDVAAAGELTVLGDVAAALPAWPRELARCSPAVLDQAAARYLAETRPWRSRARRVLDTMPFNFLNLGLAGLMLPGARAIRVRRHPGDLALRCLFKNFAGRRLAFTTSAARIADWMEAFEDVMALWRAAEALPVLELAYEDLVADPEAVLRAALSFLGLPWDARVLEFHRADVAMTGDRPLLEPVHDREVGRWRHYREILRPVLERMGEQGLAP